MPSAAAILWTGGKDSCLAWLAVRERLDVRCLATFVPDPPRPFRAHPLETMRAQAAALGLPHRELPVGEPYEASYEAGIDALAADGTRVLVTGDIDRVDGHPNWIVERARDHVAVERPLWELDREAVLRRLLAERLRVVITLARTDSPAAAFVGREFDAALVDELLALHGRDGFDACGENGEYHTCVLDAPGFARPLELTDTRVVDDGAFRRLVIGGVR